MANRLPSLSSAIVRHVSDDELLLHVSKAIARQTKAAWRSVRVGVHGAKVRVAGVVPSADDRNLIVTIASQVPGVLDVEDCLTIGKVAEPSRLPTSSTPAERIPAEHHRRDYRDAFLILPELSENLESILSKVPKAKPPE